MIPYLPETDYLRSSLLHIPHGMFNRHNGTSLPPFSSLNISYGVTDHPKRVTANRQWLKKTLGVPFLLSAGQIHGDRTFHAPRISNDMEVDGFDALITSQPSVGLLIMQADCQAILLHDPCKKVIAAIHCGWRGSVLDIIGSTIADLQKEFQTVPSDLLAAISPSLGPCCAEFVNYRNELPSHFHAFREGQDHFNFWKISKMQLIAAGVLAEHIDIAEVCTCCNRDYFSFRRAKQEGKEATGRTGSVISLPPL